MIEAWFDGACGPVNPGGHAAFGCLVKVDGKAVLREGKYLGCGRAMSSNVAEYAGCLRVLEYTHDLTGHALIPGDCKLVIMQLKRKWKSHSGLYLPYYCQALHLTDNMRHRLAFQWIPREENAVCDRLSKRALVEMGVELRIQPQDEPAISVGWPERIRPQKGQR